MDLDKPLPSTREAARYLARMQDTNLRSLASSIVFQLYRPILKELQQSVHCWDIGCIAAHPLIALFEQYWQGLQLLLIQTMDVTKLREL
jgi:hypothetical protein